MRLDRQLPFEVRLSKKGIVYGFLLGIALGVIVQFTPVHAFTNQFSNLSNSFCNSCTNPLSVAGTVGTSGDLLVFSYSCSTNFGITGITDTKGNTWSQAQSQSIPITSTSFGSITSIEQIWFAKALSSGSTTLTITFSSVNSNCTYSLDEGNTAFQAVYTTYQLNQLTSAPSGTTGTPVLYSITMPANSIAYNMGIIYPSAACNGCAFTAISPLQFVSSPINTATNNVRIYQGVSGFYTTTQITTSLGNSPFAATGGAWGGEGILGGVIFSLSGLIVTSGPSQTTIGCTGSLQTSTHNFALPSNKTVWFMGNAFGLASGTFQTITNISVWINSVVLHNHQPSATLWFVIYTQNTYSPNNINVNLPSGGNIYNIGFQYPQVGLTVSNATGKSHFSLSGIQFAINDGQQFALGLYATHDGINIGTCSTSSPSLFNLARLNTLIPVAPNINLPYLSGFNNQAGNMTLMALVNTPGLTILQTNTNTIGTVTSYSTITSTTTTGVATTTQTITTTVITNALQSPTGSALILTNLITYLPIWLLPLIFGFMGGMFGFGSGGLLFGILMGLIVMQLSNQLPLYTVFLDAIMIYLLLRR